MEKITLKPITKELLFKAEEPNTHSDVVSYTGTNSQERALGSLYLMGHAKYGEEDLGYVVSLISSLARREYYSEQSLKGQDPKTAFEHTLKKLNEVLDDFFKNKSLTLNIGLAAVAGEQLLLSKLGKFKVGLARNGEYIDVLNNLLLFQKSEEDEQQFSNVISGALKPGDKLFGYYPARALTMREKSLQGIFVKENQEQFTDKIALLANTANNFTCCGFHISMEEIKEIPLQSMPAAVVAPMPVLARLDSARQASAPPGPEPEPTPVINLPPTRSKIIAAELSVSKKGNVLRSFANAAGTLRNLNRLPIQKRFRGFIVIAVLVLVPLVTIALIRAGGDPSEAKTAYQEAGNNLKLAKTKIAQNDFKEARTLLAAGLGKIASYDTENIVAVRGELQTSLDEVDHVSSRAPTMIRDLTPEEIELAKTNMLLATNAAKQSVWYNRSELLNVNGKSYTLKDPATATDATLYEGNLYILSAQSIYKYAAALTGNIKRSEWGSEANDKLISLAADGNIYGLTSDGKINVYFKGEKKSTLEPGLPVSEHSRLVAASEGTALVLVNPTAKRAYLLDKTSGALTTTYKLDSIGELKDTAMSDGVLWLVSVDNKLWQIKL